MVFISRTQQSEFQTASFMTLSPEAKIVTINTAVICDVYSFALSFLSFGKKIYSFPPAHILQKMRISTIVTGTTKGFQRISMTMHTEVFSDIHEQPEALSITDKLTTASFRFELIDAQ
jgi:hypothetical protein